MSNINQISILIVLFLTLTHITLAYPPLDQISATSKIYRSLNLNEESFFFLTIPDDDPNLNFLYIRIMPNEPLDQLDAIVSDPAVFISKTNKYPNSKNTSEYYSDKPGEEILILPLNIAKPNTTFYIGVTCKKKCNYILVSNLGYNVNGKINEMSTYKLEQNDFVRVEIKPPNNFTNMFISTMGTGLSPHRLYVTNNDDIATTNMALETQPVSFNGYRVKISSKWSGYKEGQTYYALIQNYGKKNQIQINIRIDNDILLINDYESFDDTIPLNESRCFKYIIQTKYYLRDIIFQIKLYSGSGSLIISGWKEPTNLTASDTKLYDISTSRLIRLTPNILQFFGSPKTGQEFDYFYFCFFPMEELSLSIQTYLLEFSPNYQNYNYLYPGQEYDGIIPKKTVTKFTLMHYDESSAIKMRLNNKNSNSKLFGYFCNGTDFEVSQNFIMEELRNPKSNLIESKVVVNLQEITISPSNNLCINKISKNSYENCTVIAIVQCDDSKVDCSFSVGFSENKTQNQLLPRQPFYSILSPNREESFEFTITDPDTHSVYLIFNLQIGNSDMTVYKYKVDKTHEIGNQIFFDDDVSDISNQYYLPHVVKLTANMTHDNSLMGRYLIKIKAKTFSTYNLYYYYFLKYGDDPDSTRHSFIAMDLIRGQLIEDYFYNDQFARLYSYENDMLYYKENIIISFLPINSNSKAYVFKSIEDIHYSSDENGQIGIAGYFWRSEDSNQIMIKSNDTNYISNGNYYILVVNHDIFDKKNNKEGDYDLSFSDCFSSFTISVIAEEDAIFLPDSGEHRMTLDDIHKEQYYNYLHYEMDKKLLITLNLFRGNVEIQINIDDKAKIVDTQLNYNLDKGFYVEIQPETLKKYCTGSYCPIEILIVKNSYYDCDFLIVCKTNEEREEKLLSGISKDSQILVGETHRYSIELTPDKRIGAKISIQCLSGEIQAYAKISNNNYLDTNWPTPNDYQYKSEEMSYRLHTIDIKYDDIKKYDPVKIMVSVIGTTTSSQENTITYSISYSSSMRYIEVNQLYNFFIYSGEIQLFTFKVEEPENDKLYLTMSNKKGDADMYLNYGRKFPDFTHYNWKSTGAYTETIDISLDDQFFVKKKETQITGYYSLMIHGYSNTTYSLYVANNKIKMMGIKDGYTSSCFCRTENDSCYFKYEVFNFFNSRDIYSKDLIFSVDYTYGDGDVYAKLYSSGDNRLILKSLPSDKNFDFKSKTKSFIEIYLNQVQEKINMDSQLVLNVQCKTRALFDINAIRIYEGKSDSTQYLYFGENNIYSIKHQQEQTFVLYMYNSKDINFEVKALQGEIECTVYTEPNTDERTELLKFKTKDTDINSYLNHLQFTQIKETVVYFSAKSNAPKEGKSIFYIKTEYDEQWVRVPIGPTLSYTFSSSFNGYFDLLDNYDDVLITIKSATNDNRRLRVYSKLNLFKAEDLNDYTYVYSIPSSTNFDNYAESTAYLPFAAFTVNNLPMDLRAELDDARILFTVDYVEYSYSDSNKIEITVTPNIEHFKRITPKQGFYYFNTINETTNNNKIVYNLQKRQYDDDTMVVEISACQGNFAYRLSNQLIYHHEEDIPSYPTVPVDSFGKSTIHLSPLSDDENYYLYLWKEDTKEKNVDFLVYYYTTTKENYNYISTPNHFNFTVQSSSSIKLNIPQFVEKDMFGNERKIDDLEFNLVVTQNYDDYLNLGSICFLSKLVDKSTKEDYEYSYVKYKFDLKENSMLITELKPKNKYYLNLLGHNKNSGVLFTYTPIEVDLGNVTVIGGGVSWLVLTIAVIVIVGLMGLSYYLYRKYKQTHMVLKYEENDLRNMGSIPQTPEQIKQIELTQKKEKYTGLAEEPNVI